MLHLTISTLLVALAATPTHTDSPANVDLDALSRPAVVLVAAQTSAAATEATEVWTTRQFVRNVFGWPALVLGVSSAVLFGITAGLFTEASSLAANIHPAGITQLQAAQQFEHANELQDIGAVTFLSAAITGGLAVIGATLWGSSWVEGSWVDP